MLRDVFYLDATSPQSRARAGRLETRRGSFLTPMFMPVGTQATVKSLRVEDLEEAGSQILLANTYHLLLRPGVDVFEKFGGIHRFMNWNKGVLTDSGGFQVFSLPHSRRINEEGALFKSYVDGKEILLSPEKSIAIQQSINSDIMMVLDECVPSTCSFAEAQRAMDLTHRWAYRSLQAKTNEEQALFAIVQGACFEKLRKESVRTLTQMPFDGFAIGGLAVGETKNQREDFTELTTALMPENKPRYLMGVGTPIDLLEAVHRGVDMFDCIIPTALAQQGVAFTSAGRIKITRGVYKLKDESLDKYCVCRCCKHYSKAYLHHLMKSDEVLGWHLLSLHNVFYYHRLMAEMRTAVLENRWTEFYLQKQKDLQLSDEEHPSRPTKQKQPRNMRLGDFEIIQQKDFSSIRQISTGEIIHSVNPPDQEAQSLYVDQASFSETEERPLVIWDVGLGAAHNAMAWIRSFENTKKVRPLILISFEVDLDPLRLATKHPELFHHIRHPAPHALLADSRWNKESIEWIMAGDFLANIENYEAPDIVLYDLFSIRSSPQFWQNEIFERLAKHAKTVGRKTQLITYSQSRIVRKALVNAGFQISAGVRSGPKEETTTAVLDCL